MSPRPKVDHLRKPQIVAAAAEVLYERGLFDHANRGHSRHRVRRRFPRRLEPDGRRRRGLGSRRMHGARRRLLAAGGCGELTARGKVKVVARPERVALLEHGSQRENCLPGMVERTV
jgi:hypothetical protein